MDKVLLSVEEAAQALGLGRSKTYELVLDGQLQSIKIGKARRIPVDAINAFVQNSLDKVIC